MTTTQDTMTGTKPKPNRPQHLSPDGKWRSFPKVPNLLQYVSTGKYFARLKVEGKLIRRSIEATTFEEAKLALADFRKEHSEPEAGAGTVGAALKKYLREVNTAHDLAPKTKNYYRTCVKALLVSWPRLRFTAVRKITEEDCKDWAARFSAEKDDQYFNNTLSVLRDVLEKGGLPQDKNPAYKVKRLGIKPTQLQLPEPDQFQKIVELVETSGAGQQQHCADLVRFLAYSGCRLSEAKKVTFADCDMGRGQIKVWNAKRSKRSNQAETRLVPIIQEMRDLLDRLLKENPLPTAPVCQVHECEKSLTRACKLIGISRITHHDLRHLFATRCIESGVDIPTVSRWLGHVDGGALAMRVYGHLRDQHSIEMGRRVTFNPKPAANVVPMPQQEGAI